MIPNEQDKNFLRSSIDYRRKTYSCNIEKCENYCADGVSKEGSSCIFPWCDYCSFYQPKEGANQ